MKLTKKLKNQKRFRILLTDTSQINFSSHLSGNYFHCCPIDLEFIHQDQDTNYSWRNFQSQLKSVATRMFSLLTSDTATTFFEMYLMLLTPKQILTSAFYYLSKKKLIINISMFFLLDTSPNFFPLSILFRKNILNE